MFKINTLIKIFLFYSLLFGNIDFDTPWGYCMVENNEISISDSTIKSIILKKIVKLNNLFSPNIKKRKMQLIIDDGSNKLNNPHWQWSLGITFQNPDKIIIKDPSFGHISKIRFETVLEHELNHIMVNRIDRKKSIPRWFKEGFAMYYSNEISFNHKIEVAKKINHAYLFNLEDLEQFRGFNKSRFDLAYAQSAIFVSTIQKLYGDQALQNIFHSMNGGQTFNAAFYSATLSSPQEFNDFIYPYLKKNYKWFQLITLPHQIFAFLPLLLIIGFILRSQRNKKIQEKWKIEEELEEELEKLIEVDQSIKN